MTHYIRRNIQHTMLTKMVLWCVLSFTSISVFAHDHGQTKPVFEMRTYTTFEGKLDSLNSRFRDHTTALFEKHGMQNIGYWIPTDKANTLIYIISHKSKKAAGESWQAFINDPVWKAAYKDSIKDGKLVANIESVYMTATDYSSIK